MRLASLFAAGLSWIFLGALSWAQEGSSLPPAIDAPIASPDSAQAPTAHPLTHQDLEIWLDGFMPYALQRGDIAGAVVIVVGNGQILLQRGFGYADVAARRPVDPERTLFRPGSASKLFTWTAVMQLVEQGALDLDADVNTYLDFRIPPLNGQPVTLRNIMTHTAGFEEAVKDLITSGPQLEPLGHVLQRWVPARVYPPGQTPAYSNYATGLAGYIVERVSGQPFEDYVEDHILTPLGMTRSTFRQPLPQEFQADMAQGYALGSGPPQFYEIVSPSPAGGMAATGADMGRFMIAHLQDGAYGSARILQSQTARMMHETTLTVIPPLNRMALGFYEQNINGRRVIAHGGDTQFFHSYLYLYPDDNVGLFVSMNSAGSGDAVSAIRSALFVDFSNRYLPGPLPEGEVDATEAAQHASAMAGLYQVSRGSHTNFLAILNLVGQLQVLATPDGSISIPRLTNLDGAPKRWREIAPFVWRDVAGHERLAARVENGRVVSFSFDEYSPFMVFMPVPWWGSSAWLTPALWIGLAALLSTTLFWPVTAIVRRRYGARFALEGRAAQAYRGVRIAAFAVLVVLGAWTVTILTMASNADLLSSRLDTWIWVLNILALVVFVAAPLTALWNVWVVWRGKRNWFAKLWSVVLAASCLVVLWIAILFKLIAFSVNF